MGPQSDYHEPYAMRVIEDKNEMLDVVLIDDSENARNEILIKNGILLSKDAEEAKVNVENWHKDEAEKAERSTLPDMVLKTAIHDGTMVHFEVPSEVYLHQDYYEEPLMQVMKEMRDLLADTKGEYKPSKFEVIGVYDEPDKCWYCCQVLSMSGRRAKVHLSILETRMWLMWLVVDLLIVNSWKFLLMPSDAP